MVPIHETRLPCSAAAGALDNSHHATDASATGSTSLALIQWQPNLILFIQVPSPTLTAASPAAGARRRARRLPWPVGCLALALPRRRLIPGPAPGRVICVRVAVADPIFYVELPVPLSHRPRRSSVTVTRDRAAHSVTVALAIEVAEPRPGSPRCPAS